MAELTGPAAGPRSCPYFRSAPLGTLQYDISLALLPFPFSQSPNDEPPGFSYAFPAVPVAWFSWIYIRGRYLAFWSKVSPYVPLAMAFGRCPDGVSALTTASTLS